MSKKNKGLSASVINRRCPRIEREKGEFVDKNFRRLIPLIKARMTRTNDNCTILCFGPTGSGKSSLGFHGVNIYNDGGGVDVDTVGFDNLSFSQALAKVKNVRGASLMHDEGNFSKRDSMSQKNKDTIDLWFSFRDKEWFIWLNNPSADYLDKELVQGDLVNFFVFIHAKQARYYLFTRKQLQDLFSAFGSLSSKVIKKHGKRFASWDGWFRKYSGQDWDDYLVRKRSRIDNKLDDYIAKYGKGVTSSCKEVGDALGVTERTVQRYLKDNSSLPVFSDARNAVGVWRLRDKHIDALRSIMANKEDVSDVSGASI